MHLLILKKIRFVITVASVASMSLLVGCAFSRAPATNVTVVSSEAEAKAKSSTDTMIVAPTGFGKFWSYISPYKITVQQGNFISQEQASQLKEGMTREQVRFLLGTALLTDMFHEDRWDYPFRLQKPNGEVVTSKLAIYFKNNTVEKFDGGVLPTEKEYLAHITTAAIATRNENTNSSETPKKK